MPEAGEALLEIEHVGKHFGALAALDDVSLSIAAGEIHGLLGENGAGKSTLCNIVFGVHHADAGGMRLAGIPYLPTGPADALRCGVAMVHQHFSLVPDLSVVDNLLLGQARGVLRRRAFSARVMRLSEEFGLAVRPEARVRDLSVGERQRVEIVKCLMRRPRLLVLDEPTAVLLPEEIDGLLQVCDRVAASGCGIVLVTHKLAEIRRTAHRVTVLRFGRVVAKSSAPSMEIDRLVHAMVNRDISAAARPTPVPHDAISGQTHSAEAPAPRASEVVLRVTRLGSRDADGVRRLDGVDFDVHRGEIVGIAGVEGNGQSELVAVLSGMSEAGHGAFEVGGETMTNRPPKVLTAAGVGVVPEDRHREGCVPAMSLAHNLALGRLASYRKRFGLVDGAALVADARRRMQEFDIRAGHAEAPFASLSGGNQQKAVLARELTLPGLRLLVAAQPTRGLDVGAVEAIYSHIRAAARAGVAVLLSSSDLDELLAVADRLLVMYRGRVMGECTVSTADRARIGAWMAGHAV